uniref:BHLH transcription factor n=1 Tax=Lilium hybrid division I TaxID=156532 RepID=Q401N4_9LILI|nr:bHLH transcription factor [Lilium hybrid division I]
MAAPPCNSLQQLLQTVVQSVDWTYSLFWQLCPREEILVWGGGYYNGAIKTRKTVQSVDVSIEESSLQRSQQLRELYDSLTTAGKAGQPVLRPSAALSPEDLTESEWFYLICVSFSFPPGVGLPGVAFTKRQHVWLSRATEVDRKVFTRAILAKSANIQTVVCIPIMDSGVLELGTTKKVEEDLGLVQHAKSIFNDYLDKHPMPTLSEHSTSNPVAYTDQVLFQSQPFQTTSINLQGSDQEEDDGDDEDDVDGDDNDDDELEAGSDSDTAYNARVLMQSLHPSFTTEAVIPRTEQSELMHIEMSEGIRLGSSEDCSNNLDSELQMFGMGCNSSQSDQHQDDSYQAWHFLHQDLCDGFPQSTGDTLMQDLSQQDAHYSETVSSILHNNSSRWAGSVPISYLSHSWQTAFSKWNSRDQVLQVLSEGTSQRMLKYNMFTVPHLHSRPKDENSLESGVGDGESKFQKGTLQEELSANHVLAERRRREKLNERFIILRSLVPFVTKMDKASILGDTIEYVNQLRRRIQDLEARNRQMGKNQRSKESEVYGPSNSKEHTVQINRSPELPFASSCQTRTSLSDKRKVRVVEGVGRRAKHAEAVESSTNVQVSIIETDALLELSCPYRDGLLLKIMQTLDELRLEVISVQSSSANSTLVAELRAKVKEVQGKKATIVEVKKAIHYIFSQ